VNCSVNWNSSVIVVSPGVIPQKHGKRQSPLLADNVSILYGISSNGIVGSGVKDGDRVGVIVGVAVIVAVGSSKRKLDDVELGRMDIGEAGEHPAESITNKVIAIK